MPIATQRSGIASPLDPAANAPWYGGWAGKLVDNGYSVVAVLPGQKKPRHRNWQGACFKPTNDNYLARHTRTHPDDSVGIACGRSVIAIDIDAAQGETASAIEEIAFRVLGDTPLIRVGQWPRRALLYRASGAVPTTHCGQFDILGEGGFFVAYGTHPGTGAPYYWVEDTPADTAVADLPSVGPADIQRFVNAAAAKIGAAVRVISPAANDNAARASSVRKTSHKTSLASRFVRNDQGVVVDGREAFLTLLIYEEFQKQSRPDVKTLADRAWQRFAAIADLGRPKGIGGRKRWSHADAARKAREIFRRSPKKRFLRQASGHHPVSHLHSLRRPGFWTAELAAEHQAEAARRVLTPSVLTVNREMLAALSRESGMCHATVRRIAEKSGLSQSAIKQARRALLESGLWFAERGVYVPVAPSIDIRAESLAGVQKDGDLLYRSVIRLPARSLEQPEQRDHEMAKAA